ncbi:hypothetical protein DLEV_048 [Diachasmimorpha longicaudata entomopoxvirus]|uniref:Uncharacterized protein n=1 Tax=Diachasmimorpha longicaudata entomopoxvirus TaxID=109981 RepID=A0A7R5WLZ2_9POXV|nr:hypothetical protein QKK69_gp048 [Diachasmimorpha longicaudata entomopoxvirus]AKS26339.1 hypothetical protein DLEV_048 [Diachasmimorpha longicaudata entomopoxvirus]
MLAKKLICTLLFISLTIATKSLLCHHFNIIVKCKTACVTETYHVDDTFKVSLRCGDKFKPSSLFNGLREILRNDFIAMNGTKGGLDVVFCNDRDLCNLGNDILPSYVLIMLYTFGLAYLFNIII